jgi:AcrR family transcriptional regulator
VSAPAVPTRRDARRNRDLLIRAAQRRFAEQGVDASLEQVARDAGLAIGTLYRHFPCRVDLLAAAFEPKLTGFLDAGEQALTSDDPWEGLCTFLERFGAAQVDDRGFNDFLSMRFPSRDRTEAMHDRLCALLHDLLSRAQETGAVRPDVTHADVISLVWANTRIIEATRDVAPHAWRRHLYLMLDGFRAGPARELPEPPLTDEQLYAAMVRLGG